MKHKIIEVKLRTSRSINWLWNKINTPKKIIRIESFENAKVKKISLNNYEIRSKKYHVLLTFIPKKGVNLNFINQKDFPLTWFEIKKGSITHGEYKMVNKKNFNKEVKWLKEHFLKELRDIVNH
jgi:hypothetical protein